MDEEESLKRRMLQQRLAEQQSEMQQQLHQQAAVQEIEKQVKSVMLRVLDPKARERLSNLKTVKPQMAQQLEVYIFQLYQAGQLKHLTEEQLVQILQKLSGTRETKIRRM